MCRSAITRRNTTWRQSTRKLKAGAPNPFIDPANCWVEAEIQEAMFRAQLKMQQGAKP